MKIDSHQHFWIYDPREYPWISERMKMLRRDFLPDDLAGAQEPLGYDGSIAVQARQSVEESRWLLRLADASPRIVGVVGWVDLQTESVGETLAELAAHPKFAGVRHVVQDEPDDRFLLRPDFLRGLRKLAGFKLAYDLLIFPHQLPAAIELARELPGQPLALDHLAKPVIREGLLAPWADSIRELASFPNVFCKLSGLITEAHWGRWQPEEFKPYLDLAWESFGEDRLMIGSDWPVCLVSGSYAETMGLVESYVEEKSASAPEKVFGGNAARFYSH
jgi:L-fuconolactonase